MLVPTKDEASAPVNTNIDIEALILHLHIKIGTCIVLAERDAAGVTLQDFLYYFRNGAGVRVGFGIVPWGPGVILREPTLNWFGEDGKAIRGHQGVVLNVLNHPPRRVTRIISGRFVSYYLDIHLASTYLGLRTESNKLGIKPCLRVEAKARIWCFAAA